MTTSMGPRHVGVVGLGPMGANLALNLVDTGHCVTLHNRTRGRTDEVLASVTRPDAATGADSLAALVASLPRPRTVVVLVAPTGTGEVLAGLRRLLDSGDTVVDGGNSPHEDTERRQAAFAQRDLGLLGAGVASGVDGARRGLSATLGGDPEVYAAVRPLLEAVAARVDGEPCCVYAGAAGAGHYVKTIHNGVEYAQMQLVAETVTWLRVATGLAPADLAAELDRWNQELRSYVVQTAVDALARVDEETGAPFLDVVDDRAVQHGSGRRAAIGALDLEVASTAFSEASSAWYLSSDRQLRAAATAHPAPHHRSVLPARDALRVGRHALAASLLVVHAQAHRQLAAAVERRGTAHPTAVLHSWRAACIRSSSLDLVHRTAATRDGQVLGAPEVVRETARHTGGWRAFVADAVVRGVAVPCTASVLAYLDGARTARSSGAVVQALRSRLGGNPHGRVDRPGSFRTDWTEART
ncbi:NAD(P)-binding domain-containing protein [Streptomyces sp. NPDC056580]|uniref:NAD(P)-binding domain-containing protein n=1 Tax=Streptomyces sp. NPDC056580 TaxID=3345872 RepID=UPI003686ACB3